MKVIKFETTDHKPFFVVAEKITSVYEAERFEGCHLNYVGGSAQIIGKLDNIVKQIEAI